MNATVRYWLFQIPGLVVSGLVGVLLWNQGYVTGWTAWYIFLAWLLKDVALYPLTVHAFRPNLDPTTLSKMEGKRGHVKHPLKPKGMVWVRGERWQAITESGKSLSVGTEVVVVGGDGLTLVVRPYSPESKDGEQA